jgi:chromosome partitioning protein
MSYADSFSPPSLLPPLPRVIALANQKGGVGKTTTAINLGTALAAIGEEVLIVDLDPQGNASTGLGIDRKSRLRSTYDVLVGESTLAEIVMETAVPRLSVAPSTMDLLGVELEIASRSDRAFRLRRAIASHMQRPESSRNRNYTYVLVDCPPSLNLLTINALSASHSILVPLQCEFFALEGLSQLLQTVDQVKHALNPELSIHGIVLTMFDSRNNSGQPGGGGRPGAYGRCRLRHGDPAQCPHFGSAVAWQARAALRFQEHGQPGLSPARLGDHSTRETPARSLIFLARRWNPVLQELTL